MAWGLARRIFEHLFERGWLKEGDLVADPFGGIGVTGLVAASFGCPCILVELEEKFCKLAEDSFALHREQWDKVGKPRPIILQGDSRNFSSIIREAVDSIITSPPYAGGGRHPSLGSVNKDNWGSDGRDIVARRELDAEYGAAEGQIGAMKEGKLDEVVAVITSPPFVGSTADTPRPAKLTDEYVAEWGHKQLHGDYGQSQGQLGGMPEGDHTEVLDSIITSPPYAESLQPETEEQTRRKQERIAKAKSIHNGRALEKPSPGKAALGGGYGVSEGQLGAMKEGDFEEVKAVITSPPYARVGDTYWQAVATVYSECFKTLRPSGIMVVVVKDFVRQGRRVPLCDQTLGLLQAIGFKPLERIRAWLVKSEYRDTLFDDDTEHYFYEQNELKRRKAWEAGEKRTAYQPLDFVAWLLTWKQRKKASFFRRLAELKGSPRIDWEEVLIFQRPNDNPNHDSLAPQ